MKVYAEPVSIYIRLMLIAYLVAASGCSTSQPITPPTKTGAEVSIGYLLGVADRLRIIVFEEQTLSGEFTINSDGSVSMPLIGTVPAVGKTTAELTEEIKSRLKAGYLRDPRVSIEILSYRPYYILGEVTRPGEYPYSVGLTVLEAVAKAQGFTYRANRRRVYIKHATETQEMLVQLSTTTSVAPGDTVRIGERYF